MGKDLRMEVFASKDVVKPVILQVYMLELSYNEVANYYRICR